MKSSYLFVLCFLSCICFTRAQEYLPLPKQNAVWFDLFYEYYLHTQISYETTRYRVNGDTVINETKYTQVHATTKGIWVDTFTYYFGAIRNQNDKVLFIPAEETASEVLYDFNIEVGAIVDTINCIPSENICYYYRLISIDSTELLNNEFRTRWNFHIEAIHQNDTQPTYINEFSWIEGIGNTKGLFADYETIIAEALSVIPEIEVNLHCFEESGILLYQIPLVGDYYADCFYSSLTLDAEGEEEAEEAFIISPNPVVNLTNITTDQPIQQNLTVVISNFYGQAIQTHTLPKGTSQWQLDLSLLPTGVYLITFHHNGKILQTERVVKYLTD